MAIITPPRARPVRPRTGPHRPGRCVRGAGCLARSGPPGKAAGMSEAIDTLLTRAQREIDAGLLPSCQIALARNGELEVFEAFGEATTDTRYIVFSATKAFVASLVW